MIPPEKPRKPPYIEGLRLASFVWVAAGVVLIFSVPRWAFIGFYLIGMSPLLWIASKVLYLLWKIAFAIEHGKSFEAALMESHIQQSQKTPFSSATKASFKVAGRNPPANKP